MSIIKRINTFTEELGISTFLSGAALIYLIFFYINDYRQNIPYDLISKIFLIGLDIFIVCFLTALVKAITSIFDIILYYVTRPFCSDTDRYVSQEQAKHQNKTSSSSNILYSNDNDSFEHLFSEDFLQNNRTLNLSFFSFK